MTQTRAINAEFIYRGNEAQPSNQVTLPTTGHGADKAAAVENHMDTIRNEADGEPVRQGR